MIRACLMAGSLFLVLVPGAVAQQVTATGCAKAGVEAGCVILKSGAKTYNITAATPKPRPNTYGTVRGKISGDATTCMQGTLLKPAAWKATKRKC